MMLRSLSGIFFLLFLTISHLIFAQDKKSSDTVRTAVLKTMKSLKDTLILMTGEKMNVIITDDTSLYGIKHLVSENPVKHIRNERFIPGSDILCVHYSNGKEQFVYKQDTLIGNFFTLNEARMYVAGQQEAQKYYRNIKPFLLGYTIGATSGVFGNYFSLIPPFIYGGIAYSPRVRIRDIHVSDPLYLSDDRFIQGYERVARKKRVWGASIGGFAGLVTGLAVFNLFIYKN